MEESATSKLGNPTSRASLGMDAFGAKGQQEFGQNIRLAMACIEGKAKPVNTKAMPCDEFAIRQRLKVLSQDMTSHHADLLELLVRFDDLRGWESSGAKHGAAWMNLELGISLSLSWEYLRVGRLLRSLPTTTALFRVGRLSWSKIRVMVAVATAENEKTLCHAALDASFSEVARLCNNYKWKEDDSRDGENGRALRQWHSRSFSWNETSNGSTRINLTLPPEIAQAFLNSVEHSLKQLNDAANNTVDSTADEAEYSLSQRRADAAVLMAESSLQAAGRDIANADRYQVIVSVDASELSRPNPEPSTNTAKNNQAQDHDNEYLNQGNQHPNNSKNCDGDNAKCTPECTRNTSNIPSRRPTVKGAGAIALEKARRIACDCSITTNVVNNGEPTNIGRKSRLWTPAMARAIKERDQHCQFFGCTQTKNLQIHHIVHWADGGSTSVSNGICLCQCCHTKVHEGGFVIQKVDNNERLLDEQFALQQHADDISLFNFEKEIRNDRDSFNTVRKLSPTRYRFRILDANGRDVRDTQQTSNSSCFSRHASLVINDAQSIDAQPLKAGHSMKKTDLSNRESSCQLKESTRME